MAPCKGSLESGVGWGGGRLELKEAKELHGAEGNCRNGWFFYAVASQKSLTNIGNIFARQGFRAMLILFIPLHIVTFIRPR